MPEVLRELLVAILPASAAASLSAFLATWLQERRRIRREHLNAIKWEVLRPLSRELEGFYLPLLSGKVGPVTIENAAPRGQGPTEPPLALLGSSRGYRELCRARPAQTGELDRILHADAKLRHYQRFFRRFELFTSEVDVHTAMWLRYAEQLSRTIKERAELPVAETRSDAEWIDPNGLAVFVVNCQLGIAHQPAGLGPDGRSIEVDGVTMARARSEDPIQGSLKLLDELSGERETRDELRPQVEPLLHLAKYLLRELDRLRLSSKLPGRCRLVSL